MSLPRELMGVSQLRMAMAWQRVKTVAEVYPWFLRDSPGFPLVPELTPLPSEAIFDKITMSAFEGTPLDVTLRDCGINSFIIVGVAMEIGTDRWRLEPTRHRRMRLSDPEKQAHAAKRSAASLCAVCLAFHPRHCVATRCAAR